MDGQIDNFADLHIWEWIHTDLSMLLISEPNLEKRLQFLLSIRNVFHYYLATFYELVRLSVSFSLYVGSELEAVVLAPLFHDLDEVLDLRIRSVLEHIDHLDQSLLVLSTSDDKLEDSDGGTTLTLPELRVGIKALEHIKGLHGEVELAHFVAIIGDEVKE